MLLPTTSPREARIEAGEMEKFVHGEKARAGGPLQCSTQGSALACPGLTWFTADVGGAAFGASPHPLPSASLNVSGS